MQKILKMTMEQTVGFTNPIQVNRGLGFGLGYKNHYRTHSIVLVLG